MLFTSSMSAALPPAPTSKPSALAPAPQTAIGANGRVLPPPPPAPAPLSTTVNLLSEIRCFKKADLKKPNKPSHRRHHSGGWGSVKRLIESKRAAMDGDDDDADDDASGFDTDSGEDW
jgi:hypothetical protein